MPDLDTVLSANRDAIEGLIAASSRAAGVWTVPRAPGKWSPAQVVEHVAMALEESAKLVAGKPTKFPTLPAFLRPIMRSLFFKRILRTGQFVRAKTNKAMDPDHGPASPGNARARLDTALAEFDRECRTRAAHGERVISGVFGRISIVDYARFQELHTRHHTRQVPGSV